MAGASTTTVIDSLERGQLLTATQLDEVRRVLQRRLGSPQALMQELVRRGWLTVFQARQIASGRSTELALGCYLLLEPLGKGASGQVFKARHRKLDRLVALKVLRPELLKDTEAVQRFYREIEVASQMSHPNIVHAYEAGPIGPLLILAMEYVDGPDLDRLVQQAGPLPIGEACGYIRQAAVGLQYAHERGLVHRDIKPSNLLVTKTQGSQPLGLGVVKILDLGLARLQQPHRDSRTANLTMIAGNSVTQGTPDYMAPEQALDFHSADTRADIYSLGCTLFFLLAGRPPFAGGSLAEKLMKHQQAEPRVESLRPDLPAELAAVLRKMLAKRPPDRWQTPGEVAAALAPFAATTADSHVGTAEMSGLDTKHSSIVLPPVSFRSRLKRLATGPTPQPGTPRRRRGMLLVMVCFLIVASALAVFLWPGGSTNDPPPTSSGIVAAVPPELSPARISAYTEKFQGPRPAAGWQYLWNKGGPVGNPAHYVPMVWDGTAGYNLDGGKTLPRADPAAYLRLGRDGGHPGKGSTQAKIDYCVIAAYTVQDSDGAGFYRLTNSSIGKGNGLLVTVHVNSNPPLLTRAVPPKVSPPLNFDTDLGDLKPGDTAYVAVGPDGADYYDTFESFDFTIRRGSADTGTKSVLLREGFEDPQLNSAWEKRGQAAFGLDSDQPHLGKQSLRIVVQSGAPMTYQQVRRVVDESVTAGDVYRASFWVRASGIKMEPGPYAYFEFLSDSHKRVGLIHSRVNLKNGAKGWEKLTVEGTAAKDARRLFFGLVLNIDGTAWFDDVEITRERVTKP